MRDAVAEPMHESMTPSSRYDRRLLVWMALATFAGVGGVYALFEVPGLGLEHLFYIVLGTPAAAIGPIVGLMGGVFATVLCGLAIICNTHTTSANVLSAATGIRCATYVATGLLIGWFA